MSVEYTYEIVSVDEAARCMEIVYESEGRQTMRVGARLPYVGETIAAIVAAYSPVAYWLAQERSVVLPTVGHRGAISDVQANPVLTDALDNDDEEITLVDM